MSLRRPVLLTDAWRTYLHRRDLVALWAYTRERVTETQSLALKQAEDAVDGIISSQSPLVLAVLYKQLYACGFRIGTVDAEIRKALQHR